MCGSFFRTQTQKNEDTKEKQREESYNCVGWFDFAKEHER